jgi:hypothetical protein
MRDYKLDFDALSRNYQCKGNIFYKEFKHELDELFINRGHFSSIKGKKDLEENDIINTTEILFIGENVIKNCSKNYLSIYRRVKDWDWYVKERVSSASGEELDEIPEELLFDLLTKISSNFEFKRLYPIHGKTGHGKTTFIRHFFYNWIHKYHLDLFKNHIVIRISLALAAIGGNPEAELDNRLHEIFKDLFPWIYEAKHLTAMLKMLWKNVPGAIEDIESNFPEEKPFTNQRDWVLDFINKFRNKEKDSLSHDFNRVIINYLIKEFNFHFILVLDNVDQTPKKYQEEVFILCRHKMDWIINKNKFIFLLGIRSYMLDVVYSENIIQSYSANDDYGGIKIFPPAISNVLINRLKYVKNELKSSNTIKVNNIIIKVSKNDIIQELNNFIITFSNPKNEIIISKFANFNIRTQLDLTKAVFKSWKFNLLDVLSMKDTDKKNKFYSQYELIRGILMQDNYITKPPPDQFFTNIFGMEDGEHFSCILNGWYVLKILSQSPQSIDSLVKKLSEFGHFEELTKNTIQEFLKKNIIGSPQGVDIENHNIKQISISGEFTTTGRVYLNNLPFQLLYLEAMAYLTMLDDDLLEILPLPNKRSPLSFESLIKATLILIKQIQRAEKAQLDYVNEHDNVKDFYAFGLNNFTNIIQERVNITLIKLKNEGYFPNVDIEKIKKEIDKITL